MGRMFWTGIGSACLALGVIGIVLPILPTTPFVLLAAFAFARGSPRLRHWLETDPRFGPPIRDWERHGAIAPRAKRLAAALWPRPRARPRRGLACARARHPVRLPRRRRRLRAHPPRRPTTLNRRRSPEARPRKKAAPRAARTTCPRTDNGEAPPRAVRSPEGASRRAREAPLSRRLGIGTRRPWTAGQRA